MTLRKEDDDITQDINILRTNSLSQETIRYPCFKPKFVSQAQRSIHLEQTNFLKINKTGVIKNVDHHPINSRNYAAAYCQTLEVRGPLLPEKINNMKICKYF